MGATRESPATQDRADASDVADLLTRDKEYRIFLLSSRRVVSGCSMAAYLWTSVAGMQALLNAVLCIVDGLRQRNRLPTGLETRILPPGKTAPTDWIFPAGEPHSGSPGGRPQEVHVQRHHEEHGIQRRDRGSI